MKKSAGALIIAVMIAIYAPRSVGIIDTNDCAIDSEIGVPLKIPEKIPAAITMLTTANALGA